MEKRNPWIPSSAAQREWATEWAHEQIVCQECEKQVKCTAMGRQSKNICQLLCERS